MGLTIITTKEERSKLSTVIENRESTDIVFFWHHANKDYCCGNTEEWSGEMKRFRKQRKEGTVTILEANNKTKVLGDDKKNKTFYFMVIQDPDETKNPQIDPMGLAVKDGAFMVSGFIYAFKSKTNRDKSYKYIMGIK
tara:strand:+ start:162 stop:575 length:414 start_codon:yes stop_codon:yes gene_type:complete